MKTKNSITISNLSIGYKQRVGTTFIASNINLYLESGKLTALIGTNGVGKSTLLKTLIGIQKPISGNVFLNYLDIHKLDLQVRARNISIVLTEKLPPSNLTVWELIALGRQPYTNWTGKLTKNDILKIEDAIKITQIEHLTNKKHYEISDGQLQIVLIARALAQDTPIIILDEPTTHLDLLHKVQLLKLLKKLSHEKQKCILFSTHDIDMAIQLCDEIIVMNPDGVVQNKPCNLIEDGSFSTLFKDNSITFDKQKGKFIVV